MPTKDPTTFRYLHDDKVEHLERWFRVQEKARTLLDPTTPEHRSQPEAWLKGMRRTRAEDMEDKGEWRKEIDNMSVAPARPSRGVVRKLGAGFQSQQEQRQRPP
jgi:hypothetical protein